MASGALNSLILNGLQEHSFPGCHYHVLLLVDTFWMNMLLHLYGQSGRGKDVSRLWKQGCRKCDCSELRYGERRKSPVWMWHASSL